MCQNGDRPKRGASRENKELQQSYKMAPGLLAYRQDNEDNGDYVMMAKVKGLAKKAAALAMIELLIPGGTLIILTFLLTGGTLPIPEKLAAALPILNLLKRS